MSAHVMLRSLRASDVPHPEAPGACEVKVVRERDLEGFCIAKGVTRVANRYNQLRLRTYYTIRNPTAWTGYRTADSIAAVRAMIEAAP